MIGLLALLLVQAEDLPAQPAGCEWDAPVRNPAVCEPFNPGESFEIFSIESVALGTNEEMKNLRKQTEHCRVSNRIDGVGTTVFVYDIVNATDESRKCVLDWISEKAPELKFSEEKFDAYFPV